MGLGWWGYSRVAPVAFGAATALLVLDGVLMITASAERGGSSGVGGIFLRFVLVVLVYRGLVAARQLRAEASEPLVS